MKLKFDTSVDEFNIINNILADILPINCQVWVFGSRAKTQSKFNSDLDLALEYKKIISRTTITQLKEAFSESDLPYEVDVVDINTVEPYFQAIINKKKILFPVKVKGKVPALRFSEFDSEWEENKLGSVATFHNSKRIPLTESDRIKGVYPYYGASGIIDYVQDYIFDGEYILLGEDGANIVLRNSRLVFLAKGKFWVNNHAHIFQSKQCNYFLCEALERINYSKYNTGTAQPKLNSDVVKKIKLNLPTKPEQQKIANFLTTVDNKIEQLSKKQALFGSWKKGLMQKIFSQAIRFKADDGSQFPDWEERKLGDVFFGVKGKGLSKKDITIYGLNKCILYGQLYTTYPEVIKNVVNRTNSDNGIRSQAGDLLVPCSTTTTGIDLADVTAINESDVLLGGDISILRLKKDGSSVFFAYYLTHYKKFDLAKYGQGSTIVHLYYSHFKKIDLKFPHSVEEQTKIANFLSSIDTKIEQIAKQLDESKQFKKALLQQMFV